jgi:hypothetical protein
MMTTRRFDDRLDELVVHVLVAHQMREAVDACGDEAFRIGEVEDVRVDADAVLVRFVDDGAVERRTQLRRAAVAIVHPDLDEVHLLRGELRARARVLPLGGDVVGDAFVRVGAGPALGAPMPRPR